MPGASTRTEERRAQIIRAPSRPVIPENKITIFLAGTTSGADWRGTVACALSHFPVAVLDPLRPDWDASWREEDDADDPTAAPFREQVEWELDMQKRADLIAFYFGPGTDAPVSLLELGLCAWRSVVVVVACHGEYKKRGNVQIVCRRFGLDFVDGGEDALVRRVVERVDGLLGDDK
ncbi:hypothetical protein P885DRAFT_42166 [Corynascus similis CBS 632.67]